MTAAQLETFLAGERSRIEASLAEWVAEETVLWDGRATGPGDGGAVAAAARYALEGGGKRLRPILFVAAYRAIRRGPVPSAAYDLAGALELIHTYSLIHDDLPSMDDDAVRRGRPATHVAHGVPRATVAGAAMIPGAVRRVVDSARDLSLEDGVAMDLVRTLCRAAGAEGMVGGQVLDLAAEGREIDLEALERIHRLKTGALLQAAAVMGGVAAGAGSVQRDALAVYGGSLGLAFQVADDILDVTGSTAVLGKTAGRDTELEKATYPALAGLEEARERAEGEIETALAALEAAGIESRELTALARYAVERDR